MRDREGREDRLVATALGEVEVMVLGRDGAEPEEPNCETKSAGSCGVGFLGTSICLEKTVVVTPFIGKLWSPSLRPLIRTSPCLTLSANKAVCMTK